MVYLYEYIWRDAQGNMRSKGKVTNLEEPDGWNYDGSSTEQADTNNSEVFLYPVKKVKDPFRKNDYSFLVLCETSWQKDTRLIAKEIFKQKKELEPMFGLEQEFFMMDKDTSYGMSDGIIIGNGKSLGWSNRSSNEQKKYYCGVGSRTRVEREFVEMVLAHCLYSEIPITGYNFEVAVGQAEFQVCSIGIDASDSLFLFRYILERVGELFDIKINYYCKPLGPDWNGSGMHTNFSTKNMREEHDLIKRNGLIFDSVEKLSKDHKGAIDCYGTDNHLRLTGIHETSSIDKFSYGVGSRDTSVRIPSCPEARFYYEDRRPAGDADPYLVTSFIFKTTCLE
jgi:glutamine synthetase